MFKYILFMNKCLVELTKRKLQDVKYKMCII